MYNVTAADAFATAHRDCSPRIRVAAAVARRSDRSRREFVHDGRHGAVRHATQSGDADMKQVVVTIDGPAGAGKSTVAKLLARRLGYRLLDTGAIYLAGVPTAREARVAGGDRAARAGCARA